MQPTVRYVSLTNYLTYFVDNCVTNATALFPEHDFLIGEDATDSTLDLQTAAP